MKFSTVLGIPLALCGVSALATEAHTDEAVFSASASDMLSSMKTISEHFVRIHEVFAQLSKEVLTNVPNGQEALSLLEHFTSVNSPVGDSSCNVTKSEGSPEDASDEKNALRMAGFLNSVQDVTLANLKAQSAGRCARFLAKSSYLEAERAAAEAREQAMSAMRAFVATPKHSTTEMAEMLQSLKASCKASSQLTAAEDHLQNVNAVDGDDQQRPLTLATMKESSEHMAESRASANQASRMLLIQAALSGLMDNERMWIHGDDHSEKSFHADDHSEKVFHEYQLPKMAQE